MAKLLGGCLSLWIPLALAFVLALLIVLANPDVALNTEAWLRLGLFFALSCLFLGQIFALSLMVSAFVRHSSTALIICLFGWLSGGVVYLNALPSLTQYGIKEQPYPVFEQRRAEVFENYAKEMAQWEEKHPGPEEVYLRGIEDQQRLRYAHPRGYAWLQQRNAVRIKKEIERARTIHKYHWENQKTLARESLMVDEWSIFSPFSTYQVLSYQLARTTLDDKFYLTKAGRRYRETYIQYLRGKNAFGSRRWFTDDPEDQEPMIPHPEEVEPEMLVPDAPFMKARMDWVQQQEKKASRDARRQLDLTDLPKFGEKWQRSLAESFAIMTPGLAVLLLSFGLSVLFATLRFLRYDPR